MNNRFVLITKEDVYVYEGSKRIASYKIIGEITKEEIEMVRTAVYETDIIIS